MSHPGLFWLADESRSIMWVTWWDVTLMHIGFIMHKSTQKFLCLRASWAALLKWTGRLDTRGVGLCPSSLLRYCKFEVISGVNTALQKTQRRHDGREQDRTGRHASLPCRIKPGVFWKGRADSLERRKVEAKHAHYVNSFLLPPAPPPPPPPSDGCPRWRTKWQSRGARGLWRILSRDHVNWQRLALQKPTANLPLITYSQRPGGRRSLWKHIRYRKHPDVPFSL